MARIVMKFGGTSMAGTERIRRVAGIVKRQQEAAPPPKPTLTETLLIEIRALLRARPPGGPGSTINGR